MTQSKAEIEFRAKYPNARLERGAVIPYVVYAGDYLCACGFTPRHAFAEAVELDAGGYITPAAREVRA